MSAYREIRYWCINRDCGVSRVSMADLHGREYFTIVSREIPRAYREAKERALDAIETAIGRGDQPGEVTV